MYIWLIVFAYSVHLLTSSPDVAGIDCYWQCYTHLNSALFKNVIRFIDMITYCSFLKLITYRTIYPKSCKLEGEMHLIFIDKLMEMEQK